MTKLEHRAVAGSFIFKFPDDDTSKKPQVALFRRSGKVKTYQHKYAPVSGSVEEADRDPLATAWRELHEETTLTSDSLRLFRRGKPYSFDDESVGRKWTITPFAFVLKSEKDGGRGEAGIQLDWEHEAYEWFDPDSIEESDSFQGVPRLLESLRRVWFNIDLGEEAGKALSEGLIVLQKDHDSGARQLASKALAIFIDVIGKIDTASQDTWWRNVRFAGWHLWKNGRESMGASILKVVLSSLDIIERHLPDDKSLSKEAINNIVLVLREYEHQRHEDGSKVGASFNAFLHEHYSEAEHLRLLTLSSSSTIRTALVDALTNGAAGLDIRVLESRPLFEGVKMAKNLGSFTEENNLKAHISVYTDASVGIAAQGVDVVLIGADLIDKAANVSNKTGSLPAILTAKYVSPKAIVVVLSDKEKVLPFEAPEQEENDPQEVAVAWRNMEELSDNEASKGLRVHNVYFEWVGSDLIDYYITEDGTTGAADISTWAQEALKSTERFFSDL